VLPTGLRETSSAAYQADSTPVTCSWRPAGVEDSLAPPKDLVCKLEQGRRHAARITLLASVARALGVELSALVKRAAPVLETEDGEAAGLVALRHALTCLPASGNEEPTPVHVVLLGYAEIDDMNRRELLRLLAIAGASLAALGAGVDWDRLDHAARTACLDAATADEYAALNAQLWHIFAASQSKSVTFPVVNSQLGVLINAFP
jgi:hypothetical protein